MPPEHRSSQNEAGEDEQNGRHDDVLLGGCRSRSTHRVQIAAMVDRSWKGVKTSEENTITMFREPTNENRVKSCRGTSILTGHFERRRTDVAIKIVHSMPCSNAEPSLYHDQSRREMQIGLCVSTRCETILLNKLTCRVRSIGCNCPQRQVYAMSMFRTALEKVSSVSGQPISVSVTVSIC